MQAILPAIISYFGWGVGDIFGTIVTRKIGAYSTTFWAFVFRFMLVSLYVPFAVDLLKNINLQIIIINILLGFIFIGAALSFNEALRIGNASLVGTISASFVGVVVILSIIFLGEKLTISQLISILVIFSGLILSSLSFGELKKRKIIGNRANLLALLTMLGWGIYFTFIKIPVEHIGWFWPNYITLSLFPFLYLFGKAKKFTLKNVSVNRIYIFLLVAVILVQLADFSFNFGISKGLTSVVAPIAGSYPTLFALLAFIIFKDKITRQQILGITITLVGIVLLVFYSST